MPDRYKALKLLEDSEASYVSAEEIALALGVGRSYAYKLIKQLRSEGCKIESAPGRGFRLLEESDVLSLEGVRSYLSPDLKAMDIDIYTSVSSTSSIVNEIGASGGEEGKTVISLSQTKGRGRNGRSFFSPPQTGLYVSILLRPGFYAGEAVFITTAAAVAACRAIEKVSGKDPLIKWVNDIFLDGKKVCGILTEASFDMESEKIKYAVLGIGINVYPPPGGFPDELKHIAGSILDRPGKDARNRLAAEFINSFMSIYRNISNDKSFAAEYKSRSAVIGKRINVLSPKGEIPAEAVDIDENCRLIVRYLNGEEAALSSGEISIRI